MTTHYPAYKNSVVDCTKPPDLTKVKGKSVVITGGASGMGEEAVRAFVKAGAFVSFGDINEESGQRLERELHPHAQFVKCNVTSFDSQKLLFKAAKEKSPSKTVDVVIANTGIFDPDSVYHQTQDQNADEPTAPSLRVFEVNQHGVLYSFHLARFYFLKHELGADRDRCFIVLSSLAGYIDGPKNLLYMMTKFAARAAMRCIRRSTAEEGIRACALAPTVVRTNLFKQQAWDAIEVNGLQLADAADAAGAMLRIAADPTVNGRTFTIVPRSKDAPLGYSDMNLDDFPEGSKLAEVQEGFLKTAHLALTK